MEKKSVWIIVVVFLAVVALAAFIKLSSFHIGRSPMAASECDERQMLCPDGSYVGRGAPSCDFAACPGASVATSTTSTVEAGINRPGSIFNLTLTPLEIVEDSRCPVDVQCIQAGTVRVKTTVKTPGEQSSQIFSLGVPQTDGNLTIELVDVVPTKKAAEKIELRDYSFVFKVTISPPHDVKD